MKKIAILILLFLFLHPPINILAGNLEVKKPRLLILTDIGGDPDDYQSMTRFLVYSNEFRVEGLIATTNGGKDKTDPDKFRVNDNLIHEIIDNYALVRDNLLLNNKGYPSVEELHALVKRGNGYRGANHLSSEELSLGSQHIINVVDASDELLCISIWGGAFDLAHALNEVKSTRPTEEVERFLSKIRVFAINDQDINFVPKGAGEWIHENFPRLWYIEAGPPWLSTMAGTYRGMYQNDSKGGRYPELPLVKPGVEKLNNQDWIESNVMANGPLGAKYPLVNQNPGTQRNTVGVKEGDAPSWFFFLPNGLSDSNHPEWGGWGGRYEHQSGKLYVDTQDDHWSGNMDASLRNKWTVARWREAIQNDFAARMRWCMVPYAEANHRPVAIIDKDSTLNVLLKDVQRGQEVKLEANGSYDPDGNEINYKWWIYQEASSANAIIKKVKGSKITIDISEFSPYGKIHLILEIKDEGSPNLFSYRRLVLNVVPGK